MSCPRTVLMRRRRWPSRRSVRPTNSIRSSITTSSTGPRRTLVPSSNWRQRWLYPTRDRMNFVADELRQIYRETEKQPNDLDKATIEAVYKSFPGAKRNWVEKFITSPYAFNEAINI